MSGIMAAVTIKKATLILCVNTLSVEQWREQFMQYTTIDFGDIHMLTAGVHPVNGASVSNYLSPALRHPRLKK